MTDRRGADFTYGQLGEATYDTVERKWSFARVPVLSSLIQPIQPLRQCIPPSAQSTSRPPRKDTDRTSNRSRSQKKSLVRDFPQVGAASAILGPVIRSFIPESSQKKLRTADLIASGTAKVLARSRVSRSVDVLAMAYGEAGHVLRLIKPQPENHTWDGDNSVKLRALNPAVSEDGYWLDSAGTIEQVAFASDTEGAKSWLAVRKAALTTILWPVYHEAPVPSRVPPSFHTNYHPSCLDPNPVLTITSEMTNGRSHVDVSFNPWYPRQFAILDEDGYWSMWDIEGRERGLKKASPGKSGYIYDDQEAHDAAPDSDSNGWGRILWAGDVSTIIVCNKRHLAVFDLKSQPVRLQSPDLVAKGAYGRILEVKRSPLQHDKVFVLTSTRLFLLQIIAAGERRNGDDDDRFAGARVIMSCPHYRESKGTTLRLELHGQSDICTTVFLFSSNMFLVNMYKFTFTPEAATPVTWTVDALYLQPGSEEDRSSKLVGLCVLPASLQFNERSGMSKTGSKYLERGNSFYQVFSLGDNLDLSQCLLAESRLLAGPSLGKPARYEHIVAPTESRRAPAKSAFASARMVDDFIVPDGLDDDDPFNTPMARTLRTSIENDTSEVRAPQMIDARRWYELATDDKATEPTGQEDYPDVELKMSDYIQNIVGGIQHRKQHEQEGLTTFYDLSGFENFTEDVDDGAALLRDFVKSFEGHYDDSDMVVSLRSGGMLEALGLESGKASEDSIPDLSNIYDKLIDLWVTSLPQKTPGPARIAKERLVRNVAAQLCLSSIAVSTRNKSAPLAEAVPAGPQEALRLTLPVRGGRPPPSPAGPLFSSQASQDHGFGQGSLPSTPAPSEPTALAGEPPAEDPATARLRGYAVSVRSQQPLGAARSAILAHWPSAPGADPATYVWQPEQGAAEADEDSDEEAVERREREEQRRRRRMERFLKRKRVSAVGVASQPVMSTVGGSQPDYRIQSHTQTQTQATQVASSSQVVGVEMPMTQPIAGAHGSRAVLGKKKRRKTGF